MIEPGYKSNTNPTEENLKNIRVVPNPYVAASNFYESAYERLLQFTHLPETYVITIYTITGEIVFSFDQDDWGSEPGKGSHWWNLRTINKQEVSPGLYIYTVEAKDNSGNEIKHIGKFAVIR